MALKKLYSFDIEAIPPYSFELTVHKPAGWWWSTPEEIFEDNTLWTATRFRGKLIGLKLESLGTLMEPKIRCAVFRDEEISDAEKNGITFRIKRALRTEEDLNEFYEMARKDDVLRDVIEDLRGMRTLGWPDLFPALTLAVTLQMAPMKRSRQMMELLIENFGDKNFLRWEDRLLLALPGKNRGYACRGAKGKGQTWIPGRESVVHRKNPDRGFPNHGGALGGAPRRSEEETVESEGYRGLFGGNSCPGDGLSIGRMERQDLPCPLLR